MTMIDEIPQVLKEFGHMVADFRPLYQSVKLSCLAVRRHDVWVNLGTRLAYSELPQGQSPKVLQPANDFFACVIELPPTDFGNIAFKIIGKNSVPQEWFSQLQAGHPNEVLLQPVRLTNGAQPTTLSWSHPIKWVRGKSMYDFGQERSSVGIQAYGDS